MSTQFRPLEIPPGVVSNPTKQMRSSNWAEVNLMRWVEGQLTPVGGQAAYTYSFASRCKLIHGWYDLFDVYHIAYLCEANLYVDTGGVLADITPAGGITPPQPLTEGGYGDGAYGQNVVLAATAAWAPGAANIQMTANPGSVQPGMDVYNTTQNLHVGMVVAFTGGVLSLAAPGAEYAGNAGDILNFDWYGMPRAISDIQALDKVPDAWSLDNFGAILLAMTSPDGRLLQFDPSKGSPGEIAVNQATAAFTTSTSTIPMAPPNPGTVQPGMNVANVTTGHQVGTVSSYTGATLTLTAASLSASQGANDILQFGNVATPVVANSGRGIVPTGRCFVVTNERFVMMMGAYDSTNGGGPRRFAWCDQENFQAWDYSNVTSQAGFLDIEPASPIICAKAGPLGVLFWTANSTYISAFLGVPYIYNYTEIAKNSTPWSACSVVATTMLTLWMSQQGMFSYNGAWVAPVACKVRTWIDDDIDILNVREQACAVNVAAFNEFWWFFPQGPANNPSGYNTRCISTIIRRVGGRGADVALGGHRVDLCRQHHHGGRDRRLPARALQFLPRQRALAMGGNLRPQPRLGLAAGHRQADDPRHPGRRHQPALLANLQKFSQHSVESGGRRRAGDRAAERAENRQPERLCRLSHHRARCPLTHRARRTAGQSGHRRPAFDQFRRSRRSLMVTSPGAPSPSQAHPPPPLPHDPTIGSVLSNYLTQFSLWCRQGFAAQMKNNVALPGIMLQANDAPAGVAPNVWMLTVTQNGNFTAVQVPLGGGKP